MKEGKKKTSVKSKGQSTPNIGVNIRYFRDKLKEKDGHPNQTEFAAIIKEKLDNLDYTSLSDEYKKEYNELKEKEINQQLISDWETAGETPKLIAFLAAEYFEIKMRWLTDFVFDAYEGAAFVQTGGVSYNNLNTIHTQSIQYDPDPVVEGFKALMQTQKEYYEERLQEKDK